MRIATWNVNSLKARQEAVEKWLARAEPDVLLIQETKLSDADAPVMPMRMLGYEMAHHGEGRWNGVAILSRVGLEDVVTNFGDGPVRDSSAGATVAVSEDDFDPLGEARMVSAVCGGVRVVSLYAPNGREVGSPFFEGKLRWFERLSRWLAETRSPDEPLVLGGDYNVTPADIDVWSPARAHGGTHVSEPEREALATAPRVGPRGHVPDAAAGGGPVLVVGLPGRHVPPQRGHADRPPVRDCAGGLTRGLGGDRPRGAQGAPDAVGPHAGRHRPRRARPPVRRGLDGCDRADRCEDEAAALSRLGHPQEGPERIYGAVADDPRRQLPLAVR